jgi:hypothetical protein
MTSQFLIIISELSENDLSPSKRYVFIYHCVYLFHELGLNLMRKKCVKYFLDNRDDGVRIVALLKDENMSQFFVVCTVCSF